MTTPASTTADGNLKVTWVAALADPAAPTVAELTAGTTVPMECYLTADGWSPATDEATVTDDRMCSRQTYEKPGRYTDSLDTMYVFRGQDAAAADNKAFTTLKHLTTGFYVTRWGLPFETAYAAAQLVDVIPAQLGVQKKQPPEANSVHKIAQKVFVTGAVRRDVAVAA